MITMPRRVPCTAGKILTSSIFEFLKKRDKMRNDLSNYFQNILFPGAGYDE